MPPKTNNASPRTGTTRGNSKSRKKKVVTVTTEGDGSESSEEVDVLFQMDENFSFTHGGDDAASVTGDVVFDTLDTIAAIPSLKGHTDAVRAMAFDNETFTLYTASWDETVLSWNLLTGAQTGVMPHGCWVNTVVLVKRNAADPLATRQILTGAEDGNVTRWQAYDSPTGPEYLVSGQWHLSHGAITHICTYDDLFFAVSIDRVIAFSLSSGSVVRHYKLESDVNFVMALDEVLYCACDDGRICCIDIVGGFMMRQLLGHKGPVRYLIAAENMNTLYSAGDDGSVKAWMLSTGMCQKTWHLHGKPITCIALHLGVRDRFIYSGSLDGTVRCTRLASGQSQVCRSCTCTAILACDLVDKNSPVHPSKKAALTPAQIAAASLGWGGHQLPNSAVPASSRRKSLSEAVEASNASSTGRIVCADYMGHVYNYPCGASEAAVINADLAKNRAVH